MEKNKLPTIEYKKSTKKEIIFSIFFILFYLSQYIIELIPEKLVFLILAIALAYHIGCYTFAICLFVKKMANDIKPLIKNFLNYIKFIVTKYLLFFPIYALIFTICASIVNNAVSTNQTNVESIPLLILVPFAILWSPIVEECVFRGTLRRFIKNDYLFIFLSAILFGLLHTIAQEDTILKTLILAIPYMSMGGYYAYLYTKTNNIFTSIIAHLMTNTIAIIATIILK